MESFTAAQCEMWVLESVKFGFIVDCRWSYWSVSYPYIFLFSDNSKSKDGWWSRWSEWMRWFWREFQLAAVTSSCTSFYCNVLTHSSIPGFFFTYQCCLFPIQGFVIFLNSHAYTICHTRYISRCNNNLLHPHAPTTPHEILSTYISYVICTFQHSL